MTEQELRDALIYQCGGPKVTTSGPCERGCGQSARSSGLCRYCLTDDLAQIVGRFAAFDYHAMLRVEALARWEAE